MHLLIKAIIAATIISMITAVPGLSQETAPPTAPEMKPAPPPVTSTPTTNSTTEETPREKIEGLIKVYKEHWYSDAGKFEYKLKDSKETIVLDTPIPDKPDLREHNVRNMIKEYLIPIIVLLVISLLKKK